jgi:hypothetical protein
MDGKQILTLFFPICICLSALKSIGLVACELCLVTQFIHIVTTDERRAPTMYFSLHYLHSFRAKEEAVNILPVSINTYTCYVPTLWSSLLFTNIQTKLRIRKPVECWVELWLHTDMMESYRVEVEILVCDNFRYYFLGSFKSYTTRRSVVCTIVLISL